MHPAAQIKDFRFILKVFSVGSFFLKSPKKGHYRGLRKSTKTSPTQSRSELKESQPVSLTLEGRAMGVPPYGSTLLKAVLKDSRGCTTWLCERSILQIFKRLFTEMHAFV